MVCEEDISVAIPVRTRNRIFSKPENLTGVGEPGPHKTGPTQGPKRWKGWGNGKKWKKRH